MQASASIFKAYDIRGVVPATINEPLAEALGKAFGAMALQQGQTTVAVGRDGRLSGPALSAALMRGLTSVGVNVVDVGMVTTPMLYFAASTLAASGIQVTGSHNPKDYNGFKMVLAGRAIYGDDIQALRRIIESENSMVAPTHFTARDALPHEGVSPVLGWPGGERLPAQPGTVSQASVQAAYRARIVSGIKLSRSMKIVIDSGNGVAGASAPEIFRALGCEVIELFSEVDGRFPNHHPDPSKPENLRDLIHALQNSDAELGLAFDGDGDRLGIVTRDGQNIYPDRQMMLFARDVLSRVPGATIVFDVKCSQRLAPAIEAAGGVPLMYKTGHSLIKAKMKEIDSPLGGEMSGHIFFKERWYGFDDGTYAGARLLEIVSRVPDAGALLNSLPTSFSTPELNVACKEGEPHTVVQQLVEMADEAARSAGPPQASTAPSGGSALHEVKSVGVNAHSAGPPQASTAPSGGSALHEVRSVGTKKILLVKLSSLGDVVHALPVVQDIRAAMPGARIDWVVEKSFAALLSRCAGLQRVIPCEIRRWRKSLLSAATRREWRAFKAELQREAYDAVIDLQGLTKSAVVARLAKLKPGGKRYALANQTEGSGYEAPTRWLADVAIRMEPRIHAVQRSRELAARALGYTFAPAPDFGLNRLQAKEENAQSAIKNVACECLENTVALVHGTSRADKEWPLAHWIALARQLNAAGYKVALAHGNARELATSQAIADTLATPDATVWPLLALDELLGKLARCAGVIGVDSGVSHIAVALDLPHVQIYNFDTAWRTGPESTARQRSVFARPAPGVQEVWQAWLACVGRGK